MSFYDLSKKEKMVQKLITKAAKSVYKVYHLHNLWILIPVGEEEGETRG
jgi:hypothetical protein